MKEEKIAFLRIGKNNLVSQDLFSGLLKVSCLRMKIYLKNILSLSRKLISYEQCAIFLLVIDYCLRVVGLINN